MLAGVLVLALLVAAASGEVPHPPDPALACDFEDPCPWKWNSSRVVTGQEVNNSWVPAIVAGESHHSGGPFYDADNNTHGHFLYVLLKKTGPRRIHVWSPSFVRTGEPCRLTFSLHMHNMSEGSVKVIVNAVNHTQWIVYDNYGDDNNMWQNYSINIGKVKQKFSVILEFVPGRSFPLHIALDNIKLKNCFTEPPQNICGPSQFQCSANNACIELTKVCNIQRDCIDGEDEEQDCDKVPEFARCTFEEDWCGWHNVPGNHLNWTLNNGSTPTTFTGPNFDHTYQNETGMYVYVDMTGKSLHIGSAAQLESPVINPPPRYHANLSSPYYNSCFVSFYYHKYGPHSGSLGLFMIELQPKTNVTRKLWWSYGDKGNKWWRQIVTLPNIAHKYILQFEARKSFASRGDPAIDDITISPKCFCIGVTPEHINSCSFTIIEPTPPPVTHTNFVNATFYMFSSCGASGRYGPKQENCSAAYNGTSVDVVVMKEKKTAGIQQWIVPESGYYTIIAKGASGGKGSDGVGMSWGAMVRTVIELRRGQKMHMLIGQEGNDACLKTFTSVQNVCRGKDDVRKKPAISKTTSSKIGEIAKLNYLPEGGGGGGGTYIFTTFGSVGTGQWVNFRSGKWLQWPGWSKEGVKRPVVVAGGGGGLGLKASFSDTIQHGHGINRTLMPIAGEQQGAFPAGGGGGWDRGNSSQNEATGLSLLQGGVGGTACYISTDGSDKGAGGFGGGGAGCTAGGGGGGYTGGRAWEQKGMHGEGGYSWIDQGMMQRVWLSGDRGPGELYIIPAIEGCGCNYLCIALDSHRSLVQCICPQGWHVSNDSVSCLLNHSHKPPEDSFLAVIFYIIVGSVIITITVVFTFLYNRYQKKKDAFLRRKMLSGDPDVQLNRLRMASSNMMTEYNPNYEFGGGVYGLKDLKEIPREHLRLVKALGQGAFGEVYQGFFRSRPGDTVEMPVAVKTLPSLSTSQSETDFFMEALIMNKFNHPNIVHFIGVCFDTHPRYIVIELLAGGDLKTFLRESRPKPDRGSSLTMKDLLSCAIDVAKGCKYLEEHRFIHRDIAARNCLLTTKGPGRVVKIADFGMARDIYRNDYYRKGGKAMLPVKWMPPEAFLDGIFTTKTDVWSFGVVVWEVMSLGLVPYSAYTNPAVMKLVASGGRLEPPINCPSQLYAIMTQCWHPSPDDRPPFGLILERLGYCLQDPDVLSTPLPLYSIPPPSESEATVMRPTDQEECLQPDYLVPLTGGGGQGVGQQEWVESGVGANGGGPPQEEWESAGANHHGGLPESRSSQPLLLDANTATNNIPPTVNNNNTTDTKSSYHLNNINHIDQGGVIMVPSYLKTNPEISC